MQRVGECNLTTRLAAQGTLVCGSSGANRESAAGRRDGRGDAPVPPERPALLERPDVRAVYAGVASDTFNKVFGYRGGVPLADTVAAVRAFFGGCGAPYTWWLGPLSGAGDGPGAAEDISAALPAQGFFEGETETGMYLSLVDSGPDAATSMPGLTLRTVDDAAGVADFASVLAATWSPPDGEVSRFYHHAAAALCAPGCATTLLVAYLGGQPAAAAEVYRTASGLAHDNGVPHLDVAGLYNVCTLEAFRRRGLGAIVTRAALLHARRAGCRHAVLQASGDGYRVYARLGFRDVGRFVEYVPAPGC